MPDRARVSSLEAIESFRAKLVIYREKAGRIVDEVNDDVVRTRLWLQTDRVTHWKGQIDRCQRELDRRQQELFSANISGISEATFLHKSAVQKARHALRDAEERLQVVKQWNRQYDQRVEPLGRQVEKLQHVLSHDLALAIAWMAELTKTLAAYVEMSPTGSASKAAPQTAADSATTKDHSQS